VLKNTASIIFRKEEKVIIFSKQSMATSFSPLRQTPHQEHGFLQLGCFQFKAEQITGLKDENIKLRWCVADEES